MVTGVIRFGLSLCILTSCASGVTGAQVRPAGMGAGPGSTAPPLEVSPRDVKLAVNVSEAPYKPRLPPVLDVPGNVVWGQFRVCATTTGEVSDVTVVTSAAPEVDTDWMDTIRKWRYQPHRSGGQLVPFCYQLRLSVGSNR
jgi:hypothetical protein